MSRARRLLIACVAATVIAAATPAISQGQAPGQPVGKAKAENGTLTLNTSRFKLEVKFNTSLGVTMPQPPPAPDAQQLWFFSDKNLEFATRILTGPGCFGDPNFRFFVFCQPQLTKRYAVKLGPLNDKLKIRAEVPRVPKLSFVDMGAGNDSVQGGKSNEKIDTGKGNDTANPGKGKDTLNLGPGNDRANTRDGKPDVLNGGKGDDSAVVDRGKDKVKNVENVKRK